MYNWIHSIRQCFTVFWLRRVFYLWMDFQIWVEKKKPASYAKWWISMAEKWPINLWNEYVQFWVLFGFNYHFNVADGIKCFRNNQNWGVEKSEMYSIAKCQHLSLFWVNIFFLNVSNRSIIFQKFIDNQLINVHRKLPLSRLLSLNCCGTTWGKHVIYLQMLCIAQVDGKT